MGYNDHLSGIARDVLGDGRAESFGVMGEYSQKGMYDACLEDIRKFDRNQCICKIDGEIRYFSIKKPKISNNYQYTNLTMFETTFYIFSQKVQVEYVKSVEYGSLYRKNGDNAPFVSRREMESLLRHKLCEKERELIRARCEMRKVNIGNEEIEAPKFASTHHPNHPGRDWALLGDMCYPLSYVENGYILDSSRIAVSLDELYSF